MASPLIDIHSHLSCEDYDQDRDSMLERALEVCSYIIDIGAGTSPEAFNRARALAEKHPRIFFTAGVHPHDADTLGQDPKILSQIESLLTHPKCLSIGECGLDYYYKNSSKENQLRVFDWHIERALKYQVPLMIHTRDAEDDTMKALKNYSGSAVFHCFTGTQALADFGVSKGFMVSFSGIVTFKSAEDLRQVFLKLPLENIVVETDAPFLAPVPMRGKRNESAFVKHTAEFLAKLKGLNFEDFAEKTSRNAHKLFCKLPAIV